MDNAPTIPRNPLAPVVVDLIRQLRAEREAKHVAVGLIAERDGEVKRVRAENIHLRAQLRAMFSGQTIADERQALETDADHRSVKAAAA